MAWQPYIGKLATGKRDVGVDGIGPAFAIPPLTWKWGEICTYKTDKKIENVLMCHKSPNWFVVLTPATKWALLGGCNEEPAPWCLEQEFLHKHLMIEMVAEPAWLKMMLYDADRLNRAHALKVQIENTQEPLPKHFRASFTSHVKEAINLLVVRYDPHFPRVADLPDEGKPKHYNDGNNLQEIKAILAGGLQAYLDAQIAPRLPHWVGGCVMEPYGPKNYFLDVNDDDSETESEEVEAEVEEMEAEAEVCTVCGGTLPSEEELQEMEAEAEREHVEAQVMENEAVEILQAIPAKYFSSYGGPSTGEPPQYRSTGVPPSPEYPPPYRWETLIAHVVGAGPSGAKPDPYE